MKKLFIILSIFILFSKTIFAQTHVQYGAKEKYILSNNEKKQPIDSTILLKYEPYNQDIEKQVPLQRYINAPEYDLFIGLAIFNTPEQMVDFYKNNKSYNIQIIDTIKIKKTYFYKIFSKYNDSYNLKIIFKSKKSYHTAILNFVSKDKKNLEKLNDNKYLFKEKLCKKIK